VKNGEFWANYKRYWEILEREFHLEYDEIQAITKLLVEEALNREVTTPWVVMLIKKELVEEALNREVTTPSCWNSRNSQQVEEALKQGFVILREVTTPLPVSTIAVSVEEALLNLVPVEDALYINPLYTLPLKRKLL
jgi:hypothetical protein